MYIITHRGLDPLKNNKYGESTFEAFSNYLERGYGIEFDVRITKDNHLIVIHDKSLERISNGADKRLLCNITLEELLATTFNGHHLTSLNNICTLITKKQSKNTISAIHLKADAQDKKTLDIFLNEIQSLDPSLFLIFDTTPQTAMYLKKKNPALLFAPSVSHQYDIERYGKVTGNTLLTLNEALQHKDIFTWLWLDEWDLSDKENKKKRLYTKEIFQEIRLHGFKIALVTPELHATSPNLLGGENHPDAQNIDTLMKRLQEIIDLKPDALCTDYPDIVKKHINKQKNNYELS